MSTLTSHQNFNITVKLSVTKAIFKFKVVVHLLRNIFIALTANSTTKLIFWDLSFISFVEAVSLGNKTPSFECQTLQSKESFISVLGVAWI